MKKRTFISEINKMKRLFSKAYVNKPQELRKMLFNLMKASSVLLAQMTRKLCGESQILLFKLKFKTNCKTTLKLTVI